MKRGIQINVFVNSSLESVNLFTGMREQTIIYLLQIYFKNVIWFRPQLFKRWIALSTG